MSTDSTPPPSGRGPGPDPSRDRLPVTSAVRSSDSDDENSLCESDDDYLARCKIAASAAASAAAAAAVTTASASSSSLGGGADETTATAEATHFPQHMHRQPSIVEQTGRVEYSTGTTSPSAADAGAFERTTSTPLRTFGEERMRRKLQFFFMNPIEKWQTRRRFPYKFLVQVVKLVLVSIQLCLFAHSRLVADTLGWLWHPV